MTDEELRRLLAEATPGPWRTSECNVGDCWCCLIVHGSYPEDDDAWIVPSGSITRRDAELASAAPTLATEVLRLRQVVRDAAETLGLYALTDAQRYSKAGELRAILNDPETK